MAANQPYLVDLQLKAAVRTYTRDVRKELEVPIRNFIRAIERDNSSVRKAVKTMHAHVARGARQRIIDAYQESGIGKTPAYRHGESDEKMRRYAGGAMRRALSQPQIITYDTNTLRFINRKTLDRNAKQWYRLNFGAGPRGRGGIQPKIKGWQMGGRRLNFTMSLAQYPKSGNFKVPHSLRFSGAWSNTFSPHNLSLAEVRRNPAKGRGGALYLIPMRKAKNKSYYEYKQKRGKDWRWRRGKLSPHKGTTRGTWSKRGIKGSHFLEQGADYINREYPRQLESLIDAWFYAAKDSIGRRRPFAWTPI